MKINESLPVQVPATTARVASSTAQAETVDKARVADKVSVPSPQDRSALDAVQSAMASGRSQRVQEIIRAVKSGQYYPSPQQIAQRLVNDAEVEARLRILLSR
jgi:anti-sigma28 factor (negative regulator of flagellin synthesis)